MSKSLIIIGSRPQSLYGYDTDGKGNVNPEVKAKNAELLKYVTQYLIDNDISDVYSTLDIGSETIGAKAAVNANYKKGSNDSVKLHALTQFPNQAIKWPQAQQNDFNELCNRAYEVKQISNAYSNTSQAERREFLKNIVANEQAEVLMIYDGHEGESAMYTLNALKSECRKAGVNPPKFLNPKTLTVSEKQPFPDRPRIVSQERIDEINAKNKDKIMAGRYTREERKYMSDVWNAYLNKLTLRPEHEIDLLNRGFTKEQITEFNYKSLPQTKNEADDIINSLRNEGWDLSRAPGFAIAEDGGAFSTQIMKDGYFCPARDTETGLLYGMQIRNCNKEEAEIHGKYTWFSAGKNAIGLSSSQPAAYYKGNMTVNVDNKERPVILITEGVLKCNLAYLGMGRQIGIVGMAGVYGEKGLYVYDEKGEAEALNPDEARHLFKDAIVVECFDADFEHNINVRNASYRIRNELIDNYGAYATCRMTWDDDGKGIDDYVVDCNRTGKDIHYNLSNVIMTGSPTEVVINEYDKHETRHVEIKDIEQSPLKGLTIDIKMKDVYDAGYKIQPKIDVPKTESENKTMVAQPVKDKNSAEYKRRKYVEHLNERMGRREPVFQNLLPARMDNNTKYMSDAGKFIVEMHPGSNLDSDLRRRIEEIKISVGDILGTDESNIAKEKLIITDTYNENNKKYVCVLFDQFDGNRNNVSKAIKGSISELFYKDCPIMGRTYCVSNTEWDSALKYQPNNGAYDVINQVDYTNDEKSQSLNSSLVSEKSKDDEQWSK